MSVYFRDALMMMRELRSYRVIFQRDASNESRAGRGFNKPGHNSEGGLLFSDMCQSHKPNTLLSVKWSFTQAISLPLWWCWIMGPTMSEMTIKFQLPLKHPHNSARPWHLPRLTDEFVW